MAAISLFWYTNMAAVTSDENDLYILYRQEISWNTDLSELNEGDEVL
jgi:hypothetical protein